MAPPSTLWIPHLETREDSHLGSVSPAAQSGFPLGKSFTCGYKSGAFDRIVLKMYFPFVGCTSGFALFTIEFALLVFS